MNIYYKNHVRRMRMDICDLEKTEIILGMPWLAVHNPEINWETGEVKMMKCLSLCGGIKSKEKEKKKRERRVATLEEEKIVRWVIDDKEDWGREEKIKEDHRKIEEMVLRKFLKWRKVFGKVELERIPTRKVWDHAIDLKKTFKLQKERIYPLSKNEREEFCRGPTEKGVHQTIKVPSNVTSFLCGQKEQK